MIFLRVAPAITLGAVLLAAAATAAPRDPDWPCRQIKVAQLSLASIWSGPSLDRQLDDWRGDQQVVDLAHALAQRRMPLEQAQQAIHAFAQQAAEQKQPRLMALFAGLFVVLDDERSLVVSGLERFGARQKELAAGIRENNEKLRAMQADPAAEPGEVTAMAQRIAWEAEVFEDRRQSLSYACDVPARIEQRLFTLARTIRQELD
jgi:hypothetical protein